MGNDQRTGATTAETREAEHLQLAADVARNLAGYIREDRMRLEKLVSEALGNSFNLRLAI